MERMQRQLDTGLRIKGTEIQIVPPSGERREIRSTAGLPHHFLLTSRRPAAVPGEFVGTGEPSNINQTHISLTALDSTYICPVEVSSFGQGFLRKAHRMPPLSDGLAELNTKKTSFTIQVKANLEPKPGGGKGAAAIDWWVDEDCPATDPDSSTRAYQRARLCRMGQARYFVNISCDCSRPSRANIQRTLISTRAS